jgi:hypothetical protein
MDQSALLDDLDRRQNAVLEHLDALNASVEALLKECLVAREQACQSLDDTALPDPTPSGRGAPTSRSRGAAGGRRGR